MEEEEERKCGYFGDGFCLIEQCLFYLSNSLLFLYICSLFLTCRIVEGHDICGAHLVVGC